MLSSNEAMTTREKVILSAMHRKYDNMESVELDRAHSPTRLLLGFLFLALSLTPLQYSPQGQSVIVSKVTRQAPSLSRFSVPLPGARFPRVTSFEDLVQFFKGTAPSLNEEQVDKAKLEDVPKDKKDIAA